METTAARPRLQHKPYRPRKNPAGRVAITPIRVLNQSGTLTDKRLREHERERSPEQSEALALWIAKARQTLERLLVRVMAQLTDYKGALTNQNVTRRTFNAP